MNGEPSIRNIAQVPWDELPGHFGGALSKLLVHPQTVGSRHVDHRISTYAPNAYVAPHTHKIQEQVYPGEYITFWVFAPLGSAMGSPARLPSPTIRVEEGDVVYVTLHNTHYLPHTIHFHGLAQANDMDGVPDGYRAMNDRKAIKVMVNP